ncbi:hypothetical protein AX15_007617 [Amanita polypyramis BW_CC]|nr:hypothetical protein AX15_007617 [Amanita polypyramis BW_CC]
MNFLFPLLQGLLLSPSLGAALRVPVKQIKAPPPLQRRDTTLPSNTTTAANALNLTSVQNLLYLVDLTVGGVDYPVQLDTGSSDLWIKSNTSSPLPNVTRTSTTFNLTYAVGWASGYIAYAPIDFAGLSIPKQVFVEATQVNNAAVSFGGRGIAGLGFTSLSALDAEGNQTRSNADRSLLYNLFQANPSEPNFIGFMLQRNVSAIAEPSEVGSFSIGEYEPGYEDIANRTSIPTWPVESPKRWTVLLDAVIVGEHITVPSTSVPDAPSNKAVVLVDSGSSYTYLPKDIVDAIYSNGTGAKFDNQAGRWVIPCSYEIDMALQIGGQVIPVHPLDVTYVMPGDATKCVGSFIPGSFSATSGEFDWLLGDNFLRSVYAVYDYGDFDSTGTMGNPHMKLLSLIDPNRASVEFHSTRGGTPNSNITYVGLSGSSIEPVYSLSQDVTSNLQTISKIVPAMLAVVAFNALLLVALVIAGIVYVCRRREGNARARPNRGRVNAMNPMPMNPRNSYIPGVDPTQQPHRYEPVSMALTEDTLFAPPVPAFHKFNEDGPGGSQERPKSVA